MILLEQEDMFLLEQQDMFLLEQQDMFLLEHQDMFLLDQQDMFSSHKSFQSQGIQLVCLRKLENAVLKVSRKWTGHF